jgi:hypothetical protein
VLLNVVVAATTGDQKSLEGAGRLGIFDFGLRLKKGQRSEDHESEGY